MRPWNVYMGSKLIDTVWFDEKMDKVEVYNSLVSHDGYHPRIRVSLAK